MRELKPLTVDDEDYDRILGEAEIAVEAMRRLQTDVIPDCHHETIVLAYLTWKKIAEERQETIDYLNDVAVEAGEYFGNEEG